MVQLDHFFSKVVSVVILTAVVVLIPDMLALSVVITIVLTLVSSIMSKIIHVRSLGFWSDTTSNHSLHTHPIHNNNPPTVVEF